MSDIKVLWVDDEIDLLKPHIIFLENKNYDVTTAKSGTEAIEEIKKNNFDIVFLDENMPGLTGLETLSEIKERLLRRRALPIKEVLKVVNQRKLTYREERKKRPKIYPS